MKWKCASADDSGIFSTLFGQSCSSLETLFCLPLLKNTKLHQRWYLESCFFVNFIPTKQKQSRNILRMFYIQRDESKHYTCQTVVFITVISFIFQFKNICVCGVFFLSLFVFLRVKRVRGKYFNFSYLRSQIKCTSRMKIAFAAEIPLHTRTKNESISDVIMWLRFTEVEQYLHFSKCANEYVINSIFIKCSSLFLFHFITS